MAARGRKVRFLGNGENAFQRPPCALGCPRSGLGDCSGWSSGQRFYRAAASTIPQSWLLAAPEQFAIVAQRRAGRPFLALLCSLGFRLAYSATGSSRLRPLYTREPFGSVFSTTSQTLASSAIGGARLRPLYTRAPFGERLPNPKHKPQAKIS